jgi:cytochrome b pre-mRNA-processing protein 3
MKKKFLYIYNHLIKLSKNENLYINLTSKDTFSDRLHIFLIHYAFFLKNYKNQDNKKNMQNLYDFIFRQIELSIREIGYGDQTINKKMKDVINIFHSIISEIHFWDTYSEIEKNKKISFFLENFKNSTFLSIYFNNFNNNLKKITFNSYLERVEDPNYGSPKT